MMRARGISALYNTVLFNIQSVQQKSPEGFILQGFEKAYPINWVLTLKVDYGNRPLIRALAYSNRSAALRAVGD